MPHLITGLMTEFVPWDTHRTPTHLHVRMQAHIHQLPHVVLCPPHASHMCSCMPGNTTPHTSEQTHTYAF